MRISIVLPYYNAAEHLEECLDSIVQQSLQDFELITINDGSTDTSAQIVNELAARDGRIVAHDITHAGIVAALNTGIRAARAQFIVRMDADDVMTRERLAVLWQAAEQLPQDYVLGSCVRFLEAGGSDARLQNYIDWSNQLLSSEACRNAVFVDAPLVHPTICFPRELILQLGLYRDMGWPEDYDLMARAAQAGVGLFKSPEQLLIKRDHQQSLSRMDARYARAAMLRAKAHFLLKHEHLLGRRIAIIGSGTVGRDLARELENCGQSPALFVDQKSADQQRRVQGVEAVGIDREAPDKTFTALRRQEYFYLLCIGDSTARSAIRAALEACGLREWTDFVSIV